MNVKFVYFSVHDSKREPIGSVMATDTDDARKKISMIKKLPELEIDRLFVIEKKEKHGTTF